MSNKQSSVEWLITQLQKSKDWHRVLNEISQMSSSRVDIIEQAKAMHKEESKVVFECGRNFQLTGENTFEQVYNETFEGGNK